jgi:hypothetical protein
MPACMPEERAHEGFTAQALGIGHEAGGQPPGRRTRAPSKRGAMRRPPSDADEGPPSDSAGFSLGCALRPAKMRSRKSTSCQSCAAAARLKAPRKSGVTRRD